MKHAQDIEEAEYLFKVDQNNEAPYKQELKRGLSPFMNFTLCFTSAAIVPSIFMQLEYSLKTGGPVVMLYGWFITGVFSTIVGSVLAEICSTYPVAGCVYYWYIF